MPYEKLTDVFEITKTMFNYPWLEYPDRTKEFRKAVAPVHLPLSCYKLPKEEYPPSPDLWRLHPKKPNATPFCHATNLDLGTGWRTLKDQRKDRESQKVVQKKRNVPRYLKESSQIQNLHLSISKLTLKSKVGSRSLDPTTDPMKWKRLKELTNSLNSPREDEQCYAAQALGCLGINNDFVMEALWQVAQTGPEKVKDEAYRTLAILGCLNKYVIQALIRQLTGQNESKRIETLMGLQVALNSWAAVPKDKRCEVGDEEELVFVLQMLMNRPMSKEALEAALCLGFLRPCSTMAQDFLLQCLCRGPKTQRMKALRMLVRMMHIHSAAVTMAILDQLCSSDVLEDRFEASQMLKTIGIEKIQEQGLEDFTFDLLKRKIHNEPFLAVRKAVAETVEELEMKPMMMNLVEEELMSTDLTTRQEAVISLGVLGIPNPNVFHLLLDMLDTEVNQNMKKSLQETLLVWTSAYPWIQNNLKTKVFFVYEATKCNVKAEPTRFRKEPKSTKELYIQDFQLAKLNPLFKEAISKTCKKINQKKELSVLPPYFFKPQMQRPPDPGPWQPKIREQLRKLLKLEKRFSFGT